MTKHSYTTKNNIGKKNVLENKKKKKKEEEEGRARKNRDANNFPIKDSIHGSPC